MDLSAAPTSSSTWNDSSPRQGGGIGPLAIIFWPPAFRPERRGDHPPPSSFGRSPVPRRPGGYRGYRSCSDNFSMIGLVNSISPSFLIAVTFPRRPGGGIGPAAIIFR